MKVNIANIQHSLVHIFSALLCFMLGFFVLLLYCFVLAFDLCWHFHFTISQYNKGSRRNILYLLPALLPVHRHWHITRQITIESSLVHIVSGGLRVGFCWCLSSGKASHY